MENITIKKVDYSELKDFLDEQWKIVNQKFNLPPKDTFFYAIYSKEELIGYTKLDIRGGVLEIRHILIKENLTGKGVGSKMMTYLEDLARKNNCRKIVLKVPEVYKKSISFYEKYGYKKDATLRNYYYDCDWYYMSKNL